MSGDQVLKAAIGAPLGVGAVRSRPMVQIAAGIHSETGSAAPMRAVDCDGCWLGEQPVTAPEDWQRVIAAGVVVGGLVNREHRAVSSEGGE